MLLEHFDSHTIKVLEVLFELFFSREALSSMITHQQVWMGLMLTLFKHRIEKQTIARTGSQDIGKDLTCRIIALNAVSAFIPFVGSYYVIKLIMKHSVVLNRIVDDISGVQSAESL